jgi:hypothetical protein
MKYTFLLIGVFLFCSVQIHAQVKDTLHIQRLSELTVFQNKWAFERQVEKIRKIYPYALHAASLLKKFDAELLEIDSKRKKKKYNKKAHEKLKEDYTYVIRDLYRQDGVLLMKLIHRETGLTAGEIIQKYRGKFQAEWFEQIGKIWEQNFNVKYDPAGEDFMTEQIILQIQNEVLEFNPEPQMVDKKQYKINMKVYREDVKESRKRVKEIRHKQKEIEKANKKLKKAKAGK